MSTQNAESHVSQSSATPEQTACATALGRELGHLKSTWWCFFLLGILLATCGTVALVFPQLTILTNFAAVVVLGAVLLVGGVATIITSFWAGKWSGTLLQLLVGILYIMAGFVITEQPLKAAVTLTFFLAAFFIVVGAFRTVAAFVMRFPHWGWAALNGVITFLIGVIIFRHFPDAPLWVIGVLVGVEMLFYGWTWIMMALALRGMAKDSAALA